MCMKRISYFIICSLFCLGSCEKPEVNPVDETPEVVAPEEVDTVVALAEVYCSEVPETGIAEEAIAKAFEDSLSHEALVEIVGGQYYRLSAIYNCFERNDSLFYVVQPRDEEVNNLNCLAWVYGEYTYFLGMTKEYVTYWIRLIGVEEAAYRHQYTYTVNTKTLDGFTHIGYTAKNLRVLYASKTCLILSSDAIHTAYDGDDKHNSSAQFSRIVYKAVDESELPDCEVVDRRK